MSRFVTSKSIYGMAFFFSPIHCNGLLFKYKKPFLKKQRTSWSINNWVVCVTLPGIYHLFCQTILLLLCNDSILHNVLDSSCPSFEPFKCPGEEKCIAIQVKSSAFKTTYFYSYFQYLCDGAVDCNDGYDEDTNLCTAGNIF